ncbi:thiamine phosphate synthase [Sphingomonas sp. MA1305]|uniref:thiamine phosphate synthase n=1 Tax=Sphingomonas sp. MA1305 TaxID=2479204 RepID=UPI002FCCF3BE
MRDLNRNLDPRRAAWLMTDARVGDVIAAIRALPPGAGIVFRQRELARGARHALFLRVRRLAKARRMRLSAAGGLPGAAAHGGRRAATHPAHDRRQAIAAVRAGATLLFVSPLFATRSHPGAAALGPGRAVPIARGLPVARIALGGMDGQRWLRLRRYGFDGWAAIDALAVAPAHAGRAAPSGARAGSIRSQRLP